MTKMKLSDLKVGDRFTIEAEIVEKPDARSALFVIPGLFSDRLYAGIVEAPRQDVTKLLDPPRDLVKGERIKPSHSDLYGEYIGRDFVWWDEKPFPVKLAADATTEFYDVISE